MINPFQSVPTVLHAERLDAATRLPLTVRTVAAPWSYAVSFPPSAGQAAPALFGLKVTLRVASGRIGVGCLTLDGAAYLDEAYADASATPLTVELLVEAAGGTGPLMVRNASESGASEVTVMAISAVDIAVEDDWPTALSQPQIVPNWAAAYGTPVDSLAQKARVRRFQRLTVPITLTWRDGLRFRVVPDEQVSRAIYVSGTYEPQTLRVLRTVLPAGGVFIDAGANAGIVSLAAAAWVGRSGRVIGIEPSAREFRRLEDTVALNDLPQVTTVLAAVAAEAGPRTLRIATRPRTGLNTLGERLAYPNMTIDGFETIDAITLDGLVARERLRRVDAIKLDVEGAETEALAGATEVLRRERPVVVVEVCASSLAASGSSVAALAVRLAAAGYACFEIDDVSGDLQAAPVLVDTHDRNVVAVPVERTDSVVDAVRRRDSVS